MTGSQRGLVEDFHLAQSIGDNLPYELWVDSGEEIQPIKVKILATKDAGRLRYCFVLKYAANAESQEKLKSAEITKGRKIYSARVL